ncbi:MAG: hypothetical protein ACK2UB_11165, partial [Anaerolineales bacterium]
MVLPNATRSIRRRMLPIFLFLLPLGCNLPAVVRTVSAPETTENTPASASPATQNPPSASRMPGFTPSPQIHIVPIPSQAVSIEGHPYTSYQAEGSPFRFVCPDPCPVDPDLLFAQYAGFHSIYENLIGLTGVDTLPELQPVDIHILNDPKCGNRSEQRVLAYSNWNSGANAFICSYLFEYAEGAGGAPYTAAEAVLPNWQDALIHEYLHTLFFGRITRYAGAMHDFVTPIAIYAWLGWSEGEFFCEYDPVTPPGDFGGYLLQQLCRRYGFHWEHLARVLTELDALYTSGGGVSNEGFQHPVPDMAQFRDILNRVLETDTTPAFINACWPSVLFGETYALPASCTDRTAAP